MVRIHPLWPRRPTLADQPVYWPRFPGGRSLLDPLRPFLQSRNYNWRGFAFPDTSREAISARGQVEDQMSVAPGSFLLTISAHSSQAFPNDFRFDIYDKGSQRSLSSDYFRYMASSGGPHGVRFPNRTLPLIVEDPFVISDPGLVLVRIVNLATTTNNIRLFLTFAEPRGGR